MPLYLAHAVNLFNQHALRYTGDSKIGIKHSGAVGKGMKRSHIKDLANSLK
jgi:hypothetical protein